jgi:hypothetical protein
VLPLIDFLREPELGRAHGERLALLPRAARVPVGGEADFEFLVERETCMADQAEDLEEPGQPTVS